jgi:hypothetical protein
MATNVFVSFDHDDSNQVNGFRLLKNNPRHPLEFRDHSLKEPVRDKEGNPIVFSPTDPRSKPVRLEILRKFESCSKLVVLIGDETHKSDWVQWEINEFYEQKSLISGENTWKRIRGMRLKGSDNAVIPTALQNQSTRVLNWDPVALDKWLDLDPDGKE